VSDFDQMARTFGESGLVVPPVPNRFRADLRERDGWLWATREVDPMDMYMLHPYVEYLVDGTADDHLAITHAGHGSNSYSLNFGVVSDGLAIFVQNLWGGVYTDPDAAAERWSHLMAGCASVLEAHAGATEGGAAGARLIVVDSDFRSVRTCRWVGAEDAVDLRTLGEASGSRSVDPLHEARRLFDESGR
jgi:hypothetical protein